MTAIEMNGLTKRFGDDLVAVDSLDLTVEPGEVYGFLGPNGAGKSTTINMLLDLTRPTRGRAEVLGLETREHSQTIRERIGVLPEGYDLYERLTGRDHIEFAIGAKDAADDPDTILERVGLEPADRGRPVGGYSKGMRQRLALGMALVGDPELLILDEPSSGLDPTGIKDIQELVRTEAEKGTAVFFSSHILSEVEAVCDRIGILTEGELAAEGSLEELRGQFGAGSTLRLEIEPSTDTVGEILEPINGVSVVSTAGNELSVNCRTSRGKAKVIAALERHDIAVLDFEVGEESLADVFEEVTNGSPASEIEETDEGHPMEVQP